MINIMFVMSLSSGVDPANTTIIIKTILNKYNFEDESVRHRKIKFQIHQISSLNFKQGNRTFCI